MGLSLNIPADSIAENDGAGATTATVSRTGDLSNELVVNLASNDTSEAIVPATVTIAAGQASATFSINAVDDAIVDGTQTVTITASAGSFVDGSDSLFVVDDDRDVRFDMTPVSTVTVTDANGEVDELPRNLDWIHEWQSFWVELWARKWSPS